MKRLNNKGITTVEVLICFVLVVIITVSMYAIISNFNERKIIEGYKEELYDYKNILTKDIQDDFIKIGLSHVKYDREEDGDRIKHTLTCNLKDGTTKILYIEQLYAYSSYHTSGSTTEDDHFSIQYGTALDMINYPLPDLGSYKNEYGNKVLDLSINNVFISVDDNNVLSLYIGFYHPELDTKYAINIVCPIDYVSDGYDSSSNWNYGY